MSHAVSAADQAGRVATRPRPGRFRLGMSWNAGMSHGRVIERHGQLHDSGKKVINEIAAHERHLIGSRRETSIQPVSLRNTFDHLGNAAVDPKRLRIDRAIRFDAIEKEI